MWKNPFFKQNPGVGGAVRNKGGGKGRAVVNSWNPMERNRTTQPGQGHRTTQTQGEGKENRKGYQEAETEAQHQCSSRDVRK